MQATITISRVLGGADAFRIDVARYSGDTFQFHAFYRELRQALKTLNGYDGTNYRPLTPSPAAPRRSLAAAPPLVEAPAPTEEVPLAHYSDTLF